MRSEKPEVDPFYTDLLIRLIRDTADILGLRVSSFERDIKSLVERVESEGMQYLTVKLPRLARELDRSLATGTPYLVPEGFKARRYGTTKLPEFLRTLWLCVYTETGEIKDSDRHGCDCRLYRSVTLRRPDAYMTNSDVQITAVRAIRQICYLVYKLRLPHTREQRQEKIQEFISIDQSLPRVEDELTLQPSTKRALNNARTLVAWSLKGLNPYDIVPKHGPGAVATGEKGPKKFHFKRFYEMLDNAFGYPEHMFFNYNHLCYGLGRMENMEYREHSFARATMVPKDSRGPRMISMEPLEIQWIQQGLAHNITREIERKGNITSGFVNFTNQDVNRRLARVASLESDGINDDDVVTLDMKDASDRVSLWLIKQLFSDEIYQKLVACRSAYVDVHRGHCIELRKFASMGSACCFPVEALVFWALAVGSVVHDVSGRNIRKLPEVYVFGDDLIARRGDYVVFRPIFEDLFLRFNEEKCCVGAHFRESCGIDALKGADVTPVRLKARWCGDKKLSPTALLSYIAYANALRRGDRDFSSTADAIEDGIREHFGPLPVVDAAVDFPTAFIRNNCSRTETLESLKPFKNRWNTDYDRYEWKLPVLVPCTFQYTQSSGWENLYSLLAERCDTFGFVESRVSGEYTIPRIVKTRWTWIADHQLFG